MVGVLGVYIAAHATGIGQAIDIGMLIAGGIFFGLDAFAIFKDIAGFAGAINATTEEELDKAGEHLASALAKIGVDAVMTLLTKKVADKVAGVDEPGTTTKDLIEPGGKNNPNPDNGSMRSIENVNPGFPKPGRTENCVNCSVATDATLKGNPAQALPGFKTDIRELEQLYKRKFMTVGSKERIIQIFEQARDGQKGIVLVKYKKPNPAIAEGFNIFYHVFNVDNQKGIVRFLDGQTGKIADFEHVIELKVMPTN